MKEKGERVDWIDQFTSFRLSELKCFRSLSLETYATENIENVKFPEGTKSVKGCYDGVYHWLQGTYP